MGLDIAIQAAEWS